MIDCALKNSNNSFRDVKLVIWVGNSLICAFDKYLIINYLNTENLQMRGKKKEKKMKQVFKGGEIGRI